MTHLSRRRFVAALAAAPSLAALPSWARAASAAPTAAGSRALKFAHLHTGERLSVEYFAQGAYLPDALAEINRLLRDFRTAEVKPIDPHLLDLLHGLAERTGTSRPFEIISAYRSPHTNEALRGKSAHSGVATRSLHMTGQAMDIRLADVSLPDLRRAALSMGAGGVGYYPESRFVHVDTGRVRAW
ncbi:YcbK family protein [Eleftheria terrae]|uniref:YcbK family protein n=1 Tax=Eleftheria terrae TaxID=1597781 RepID=UPI00263A52E5|nr:DUF882 domain-containing protein [Eleftheria terrae]WKB53079.1 DUF882 domain-containing protein [Eleftheria terrae]